MRPIALLMLAGLAALAFTPTAQAMCVADEDGDGCAPMRHFLEITVSSDCADGEPLCFVASEENLSFIPNDAFVNVTIVNDAGSTLDFEVLVTARYDDATSDDPNATVERRRAEQIAFVEDVAPGETRVHEFYIDGNASWIRLQAMTEDERQVEHDAEVAGYRIMAMSGGAPEDEVQGDLDDDVPADDDTAAGAKDDEDGKDAPYLGVVAVLAVLVGLLAFRRD